jgi:hypothetical protein
MLICKGVIGSLLGMATVLGAAPAPAEILTFHTSLDGKYGAEPTGSAATGKARIDVDTKRRTVSMDMTIDGISPDALWDKLVAAPIGPVHLHKYATPAGGDSVLVVPFPFGADYKATKKGLRVTTKDYDYAAGAALLKSTLSFDDFVAAMKGGLIVLNIHTDAFNPGEISGRVGGGAYPAKPGAAHRH